MSWFYRAWVRPFLFSFDSEAVHQRTLRALAWASRRDQASEMVGSFFAAPELPVRVCGLDFPNPIGLAAGMDKYAEAVPIWSRMGFGFIELGGVTRRAQPGNSSPRLFRVIREEALINRMGLNNPGADAVAGALAEWKQQARWPNHPVGLNLGKSKEVPLEEAPEDYLQSFRRLREHADFFVVNVSSPNTPGLRKLQEKTALREILQALQEANRNPAQESGTDPAGKPILVKIDPDLSWEALDDILELAESCRIAGFVATNTTVARPQTEDNDLKRMYSEEGGLSGRPLRARSTEVIRHLYGKSQGRFPIIGVGGVFNARDAWEKITAGASLVQTYTGLVYEGPGMVREMVAGLLERMAERGIKALQEAVGSDRN